MLLRMVGQSFEKQDLAVHTSGKLAPLIMQRNGVKGRSLDSCQLYQSQWSGAWDQGP